MEGRWAGLLGLCVVVAVTIAGVASGSPPPRAADATFTAVDFSWNGTSGNSVTIPAGGTVAFGYPSGASAHNADFIGSQPSCTQTAGASSGGVPPLPANPTAPGWSGTCTFTTPGTYTFRCDAHHSMTGQVVVQGADTPTPTPTSTPTPTPSPTPVVDPPGPTPTATPALTPTPSPTATATPTAPPCRVPRVLRLTKARALQRLREAPCRFTVAVRYRRSRRSLRGRVVAVRAHGLSVALTVGRR